MCFGCSCKDCGSKKCCSPIELVRKSRGALLRVHVPDCDGPFTGSAAKVLTIFSTTRSRSRASCLQTMPIGLNWRGQMAFDLPLILVQGSLERRRF